MTRRHHRLLGRLALVATLLLASVPTLGRLLAPAAGEAAHARHATAMSIAMPVAMAGMAHAHDASQATPARPLHQHDDCAYCALLGASVPTLASVLALPPILPPDPTLRPWGAPRQRALPPGVLGSRGPPAHA